MTSSFIHTVDTDGTIRAQEIEDGLLAALADLQTQIDGIDGGATPTGTGFRHITAGTEDAAAKLVDTADVNNDQITYAKMQNVSGSNKLLGRISAAGDVEEIACTAAGRALLDDAAASNQRTTLELGTAATTAATDYATAAQGVDARTPLAHATSHQNGGSDEINVAGLSGQLADNQFPIAHAATHALTGGDDIKLDDLATPDDNTDLNTSSTRHGLFPKLPNTGGTSYWNDAGVWTTPSAALPSLAYSSGVLAADFSLPANSRLAIPRKLTLNSAVKLTLGSSSIMRML